MRKRILSVFMVACILISTSVFPSSGGYALNNDARYDFYNNMDTSDTGHAKYIVPNLYRQDASYTNFKSFPLVIINGEEYVPLDIFALFSYIKVVYSKLTDGFYINNVKNNHYVAFDMGAGTTTTHDTQMVEIDAIISNHTYYVPAFEVCSILGLNFESYDDFDNGIRAVRISDNKAKLTMEELIKMYSPTKKEQQDTPDDSNDEASKPDDSVAKVPNKDSAITENNNQQKENESEQNSANGNNAEKTPESNTPSVSGKNEKDNKQPYISSDSFDSEYQTKPLNNKPSTSNTENSKPSEKTETPSASDGTKPAVSDTNKPASSGNAATTPEHSATKTPTNNDSQKPAASENKPATTPKPVVQPSTPATPSVTPQQQSPVQQQKPQTPAVSVPSVQSKPQQPAKPAVSENNATTVTPSVEAPVIENNVQPTVQDVDPLTKVAGRKLHITFNVSNLGNLPDILDLLSENQLNSVIFATREQILESPDAIRRILAEGHSIGILFDVIYDENGEPDTDAMFEHINDANDALHMVSKVKSRYIRANYDNTGTKANANANALTKCGFYDLAENNGYELFDWNIDSGDTAKYRQAQFESLKNLLVGTNTRSEKTLFLKFNTENGTARLLEELIAFTVKYPQFNFRITDEYTQKVSFIGN